MFSARPASGTSWQPRVAGAALLTVLLGSSACTPTRGLRSHELIGDARPSISPEAVQLYLENPSKPYQQIAVIRASSKRSWSFSSEAKADAVVRRLKEEAASLGANGVLLREIDYQEGASVGTDIGTSYQGPRGTADLGVGISTVTLQRSGWGIAIYLPP